VYSEILQLNYASYIPLIRQPSIKIMNATSRTQKAYAATTGRKKNTNPIIASMTAIQNVIPLGALSILLLLYD
jgi:hypothetical protein